MYPNGPWIGFWQQEQWGRQPMTQFELRFAPTGEITGQGTDVVGVFYFRGEYDPATGDIRMTKQYVGKHKVEYHGTNDGEGKIIGTWSIAETWKGPFSLQPVVRGDEPIQEIVK